VSKCGRAGVVTLTVVVTCGVSGGKAALAHYEGGLWYDNMFPTNNYASGTCVKDKICQSDNAGLSYYAETTLSLAGRTTVNSTMNNQYNPTDFTVRLESPPVYSGGAETDIVFRRLPVPGDDVGLTRCDDPIDSVKCDQFYVDFDYPDPGLWIACHEAGHAVGLLHGGNGDPFITDNDADLACMKRTSSSTVLGAHNVHMINETYS
jgi:hypothetical protein